MFLCFLFFKWTFVKCALLNYDIDTSINFLTIITFASAHTSTAPVLLPELRIYLIYVKDYIQCCIYKNKYTDCFSHCVDDKYRIRCNIVSELFNTLNVL